MQLDLSQTIEWNRIGEWVRDATPNPRRRSGFDPLPTYIMQSTSPIMAIGVRSPTSRDTWWYAGRAYMVVPLNVSFTSDFNTTDVGYVVCTLDRLTLINFPAYLPQPYFVRFKPAKWLTSIILEAWRYDAWEQP